MIPGFFDIFDFNYNNQSRSQDKKNRYFFFIGRIGEHKGYYIARDVARALGVRLIVAGQLMPEYKKNPDMFEGVEYIGPVGLEQRKEL